jgi:hypothetical protein
VLFYQQALSSNPAEKVVGSVYEHLSHCGSRPMYLYLRLNGLPRASTLSTNPVVFSDGQSPGSGPLVAPRGSDWSFKGPDCASTYVLITWHAHGQDGLSKSTDSAAYGSLDSMSSSRSVGADVMRARAAIVAHASAVQKFFVHDIRYHAFCDEVRLLRLHVAVCTGLECLGLGWSPGHFYGAHPQGSEANHARGSFSHHRRGVRRARLSRRPQDEAGVSACGCGHWVWRNPWGVDPRRGGESERNRPVVSPVTGGAPFQ